ncbi:MAG: type VI secretion system tube protein Hcp [Novosphingobium sp.]|nr:type VI secretion system tube protein Hcp [Novosphingobium sp.]
MATDIFLKLTNIKGESKDSKHKGEIDIENFQWGLHNTGDMAFGGGGGAGKVSFNDLTITKRCDLSTPSLMQACAKGDHIAEGILTVRKAGGTQEEYYKIALKHILISSIANSGSDGSNPIESVSLNFAEIKFDYKEQTEKGGLGGVAKFGWDLKGNKPL